MLKRIRHPRRHPWLVHVEFASKIKALKILTYFILTQSLQLKRGIGFPSRLDEPGAEILPVEVFERATIRLLICRLLICKAERRSRLPS